MSKIIVGICGRKRAGKDTVGKLIRFVAESNGLTVARIAFADQLKDEAINMVAPMIGASSKPTMALTIGSEKELYRPLLQAWGTYRRRLNGEDYWSKKAEPLIRESHADVVTVTDVRYPNEVELIANMGGIVVRVTNPIADKVIDEHFSEHALDDYDFTGHVFDNGEHVGYLLDQVIRFCELRLGFGWADIIR